MGSFTDAISQFNSYVQQLPVELMGKVGMQKQAQYDAGVQKVQSYIDNVAGLDIAHDADKAYLQSKLGQLNNSLKVVTAGDFSNQQLVNSTGAMTSQIIKDPIIQNAVSSTNWYKKQKDELDRAYKDGKSSIANVYDFNKQASEWLSSKEPGQVFRGRYSPYIDVQKKFNEVIKSLHPNASSEDFAYTQFIDKNGKLRTSDIAAAMTRVTKEGVSRESIENAIRASLTPDDINQMRIDADYRFKDIQDPDQFKSVLSAGYDQQIKTLDSQQAVLEGIVKSTGNDEEKQKAQLALMSIDSTKQRLKNTLNERLGLANENLSAAKLDLYKDQSIFQTANAFSWEKKANQLMENPILQAQFEKKRIDISERSLAEQIKENTWDRQMDLEKLKLDKSKLDLEVEKLYGKGSGFNTYLGAPTKNLTAPTQIIQNQIDANKVSEVNNVKTLASAMGTDLAGAITKLEEYRKNPNAINPQLRGIANSILESQYNQKILENQRSTTEKEVLATDPELISQKANIDQALKSGRGLQVRSHDGTAQSFTQKELYDYSTKLNKLQSDVTLLYPYTPGSTNASFDKSRKDYIANRLSDKERALFNAGKDKLATSTLQSYSKLAHQNSDFNSKLLEKVNRKLATSVGDYIPVSSAIVTSTPESKALYASIADDAATKYSMPGLGIKGGSAMMSNDDAIKVKTWLSSEDRNNVIYKKLNYGGQTHLVVSHKGEEVIIPLSSQEADQMPKLKGEPDKFNESIYKIQIGNGSSLSTNPTGNIEDSYYQKWKLPNVKNTVVFADLNADHSNPNLQYLTINVKGKDGKMYPMSINQSMYAKDADGFMKSLSDSKLKELYLTNPTWAAQINNIF